VKIILDYIQVLTSSILALAAVTASILAYKSIQTNFKSREAELLNSLLKEYSTKEMGDSVKQLHNFKRNNPDVGAKYKEIYKDGSPLDLARRRVSHYYQRIEKLLREHYVTQKFADIVCPPRVDSFLKLTIIPIEKAHADIIGEKFEEDFHCLINLRSK
jgi:hypothetical protein